MITTLEETIARVKDVAEMNSREAEEIRRISESKASLKKQYSVIIKRCQESAEEYEQVAAWLEELKERREADRWIPVSERLPEESLNSVIGWDAYRERCVFVQYIDGHFQITGNDESFHITAWRPLPKSYESEDK